MSVVQLISDVLKSRSFITRVGFLNKPVLIIITAARLLANANLFPTNSPQIHPQTAPPAPPSGGGSAPLRADYSDFIINRRVDSKDFKTVK